MNLDQTTLLVVCIAASILVAAASGAIAASIVARKKSYKRVRKILKNTEKANSIKEIAEIVAQKMEENYTDHEELDKAIGILNYERRKNIKKTGYIRYDSTPDIHGNLSFSVVLLNEENSGILLTNIHMTEGSSLYLRELDKGNCETNLSDEERQVIKSTCSK